jgi:tetratricopeptide (TPR) repeat protein
LKFRVLATLASLSVLSSCSWYKGMERSLTEDDERTNSKRTMRAVPREQYDQLLVKYEELSKKYEAVKENAPKTPSLTDDLQNSNSQNFSNTTPPAGSETVDVFAGAGTGAASAMTPQVSGDVEEQLNMYRRGLALKASNPGEATKIFQGLEAQAVPSVKVRAKQQIGELLYSKQQYDLALQVFEDVINKYAYSGVVLDALKYAAVCSEKLGIVSKKDQYSSMLRDVFETN